MNAIHPQTVKRIFLFFILYLPLQYILVGVVGVIKSEPWPAFVLPAFKSADATQDRVETTEARLYLLFGEHPTKQKKVDASELFEGLQRSQLQGFLRSNFGDPSREFNSKTRHWLKQRLKKLYPDVPVKGFKVEWVKLSYRRTGDKIQFISQENTKTVNIRL